jgi:hypothetical protein
MFGIAKMLKGEGEKIARQNNRRFREQIPDSYPDWMSVEERAAIHPAYCDNEFANKKQGFDYRRAHFGGRGPQSKEEHAAFAEYQRTHNPDGTLIEDAAPRSVLAWLIDALLP